MKKYELYKDLQDEVRQIEGLINKFQNELRANLQKKDINDYINNGLRITNEYYENWDDVFNNFKTKAQEDIRYRELSTKKIKKFLYDKRIEKIKNFDPINYAYKMNNLATQEKLVGINERTEEAINLKTELKRLAINKEFYKEREKAIKMHQLNQNFDKFKDLEKSKIENKKQKEFNCLVMKKNKAADIFEKKVNLHIKDIENFQGEISNVYLHKGNKLEDLRRTKLKQINSNRILHSSKSNFRETNRDQLNTLNNQNFILNRNNSTRASNFKNTITDFLDFGVTATCFNTTNLDGKGNLGSNSNFGLVPNYFSHDLALALLNLPNNFNEIHEMFQTSKTDQNTTNKLNEYYNNINSNNFTNTNESEKLKSNFDLFNSINSKFNKKAESKSVITALKFLIKYYNLPSWELNKETYTRNFCNVPLQRECPKTAGDDAKRKVSKLRNKITNLLESRKHKDEICIPVARFYDEELNEINLTESNVLKQEKVIKKNFSGNKKIYGYCETEVLPKVHVRVKD